MPKQEDPIQHSRYLHQKTYYTQQKLLVNSINHIYKLYKLKLEQLIKQIDTIDILLDKYFRFQFTSQNITDIVNELKDRRDSTNLLITELSNKLGALASKYSEKSPYYQGHILNLWKKETSQLRRNMSKHNRNKLDIQLTQIENTEQINNILDNYRLPPIELLDNSLQQTNQLIRQK